MIALKHLRTLLNLILTNSDVRRLLSDISLIGRDLLSTGPSEPNKQLNTEGECDGGKHSKTEKHFPEKRRDQFLFRAKKVCLPLVYAPPFSVSSRITFDHIYAF